MSFSATHLPVAVGPQAGLPEVGDLNGDGHLDVVLACGPCCGDEPRPEAGVVRVLLGDGRGGLRLVPEPARVGPSALRVALGDVDEDGHLDVAVIQHDDWNASVLLGDGAGGFQSEPRRVPLHAGARAHVHSVVLEDVNHDAHLDLLATLPDAHALSVHLGDGSGGFRPALAQPYFAHLHPYEQLQVLELTGDAHPDALFTDMSGNGITLMAGSGTGMFASTSFRLGAHTPVIGAERPAALSVGDLDGDGEPDVVATTDESERVLVLRNLGGGRLDALPSSPHLAALPANSLRLADLDGDGQLDLITGSTWFEQEREGVCVALGRGDGRFGASQLLEAGGSRCSVAVGDFNGDGRPDIVTSSYIDGQVRLLLNETGDD
ncbi:MAG: hypothetical protein DHS20C15_12780 [Planctomycetota bacterium]|nr:MAG: hypothetical protein DHS20C15_12780 [Planctomycetota bacterium]